MTWIEERREAWHRLNGPLITDSDEFTLAKYLGMPIDIFREYQRKKPLYVLGIDEVGRGAYAGPLVVGAVLAPLEWNHPALRDSKKVYGKDSRAKEEKRAKILLQVEAEAKGARYFIHRTPAPAIDAAGGIGNALINSFRTIILSMWSPLYMVVIDGDDSVPGIQHVALPKADGIVPHCKAASLVAKVVRDTEMRDLALTYPGYGFEEHKGYGSTLHEDRLRELGPCPIHRRTFKPIASFTQASSRI